MTAWILVVGLVAWAAVVLAALAFIVTSVQENRRRAVGVATALFLPLLGLFAAVLLLDFPSQPWLILGLLIVGILAVAILVLPIGPVPRMQVCGEQKRIDERDVIFHRFYRLMPGTSEFEDYYHSHPEKVKFDEEVRALPQLAHPGSKTYHRLASPFQAATFDVLEQIT